MNCPICKCGGTLSNLGHRCTTQFDEAVMVVFVPTFDSTGAQNGILKTQDLNKAYFDSMVNHTDPTKRWYPSPKLKEVANKRADPQYWEFSDQSKQFLFEGSRNFTALITAESGSGATAPGMKKQIESARCSDGISLFMLDLCFLHRLIHRLSTLPCHSISPQLKEMRTSFGLTALNLTGTTSF